MCEGLTDYYIDQWAEHSIAWTMNQWIESLIERDKEHIVLDRQVRLSKQPEEQMLDEQRV